MCSKVFFVSKKKLRSDLNEVIRVNNDLTNTNKILKNYIRYLKKNFKREPIGCYFCKDKIMWSHDFGQGYVRMNYCPRCGRKIPWPED